MLRPGQQKTASVRLTLPTIGRRNQIDSTRGTLRSDRPRNRAQCRVGVDDSTVEVDQLLAGFQAKLVDEAFPVTLEHPGSLGLAAGPEQREHLQPNEPVAERVLPPLTGEAGMASVCMPAASMASYRRSVADSRRSWRRSISARGPVVARHLSQGRHHARGGGPRQVAPAIVDIETGVGGGVDQRLEAHDVEPSPTGVEPQPPAASVTTRPSSPKAWRRRVR